MPPVAYKRGWVAETPPGVLENALSTAEVTPAVEASEVVVPEVSWKLEGAHWVLSIPASSASDVALDVSLKEVRLMYQTTSETIGATRHVAWPRPVTLLEVETEIVARFAKKRQALLLTLPTVPAAQQTSAYRPDNSEVPDVERPKKDGLDLEQRETQVSSPAPRKPSGFEAEDLAALLMLHSACALGNVSAVKKLLTADGASELVDACDELGSTALEKACLAGHEDVVQLLLAKGASAKGIPGSPSTPLHRTASLGDGPKTQRILKLLLDKDANPNIKDSSGRLAAELFEGTAGWPLSILQPVCRTENGAA